MDYRSASKITDDDTAIAAERKAAMANMALRRVHVAHFTRLVELIDHAHKLGVATELAEMYPLAFATVTTVDPTRVTQNSARALAQTVVDEMGLIEYELDWDAHDVAPSSADDELLRKSQAVIDEDTALKRLTEVRNQLRVFESALNAQPWVSTFLRPPPFSSNKGASQ